MNEMMTTYLPSVLHILITYVKMIDIFLIFGQMYPFTELVLLTIMEYQREGDGSGMMDEEDVPDAPTKGNSGSNTTLYWCYVTGEIHRLKVYPLSLIVSEQKNPTYDCRYFLLLLHWIIYNFLFQWYLERHIECPVHIF